MPSLTQPLPKKRRHDDFDANAEYHILYEQLYGKLIATSLTDKLNLSPQDLHHDIYAQRHGPPPRKIISLTGPRAKKLRMITEQQDRSDEQTPYSVHTFPQTSPRPSPLAPSSRHNHARTPSASKLGPRTTITTNVLAPCHVCHRRPTKKTELDSYADCQGCGERTCYVCMRECLRWGTTPRNRGSPDGETEGEEVLMRDEVTNNKHEQGEDNTANDHSFNMEDAPPEDTHLDSDSSWADHRLREGTWVKEGGTGHRGRICSRCCVEEGMEGEVTCLGCLAA